MSDHPASLSTCSRFMTHQNDTSSVHSLITATAKRLIVVSPSDEYGIVHAAVAALSLFLDADAEIIVTDHLLSDSEANGKSRECSLKSSNCDKNLDTIGPIDETESRRDSHVGGVPPFSRLPTASRFNRTQCPTRQLSRIQQLLQDHYQGYLKNCPPQYVPGGIRVRAEDVFRRVSRICIPETADLCQRNELTTLKSNDLLLIVLDGQIRSEYLEIKRFEDVLNMVQNPKNNFAGTLIVLIDDEMYEKTEFLWEYQEKNATPWNSSFQSSSASGVFQVGQCMILLIRAPHFGPPSQEYALMEAAIESNMGLKGLLPMVCAGIASGVLRTSPFCSSTTYQFVPVDIAIHIGFLCYHRLFQEKDFMPISSNSFSNFFTVSVPTPLEKSIIWENIAESIISYYKNSVSENVLASVFDEEKAKIFLSLATQNPSMTFQSSLPEVASLTRNVFAFLPSLEENRGERQKKELRRLCSDSLPSLNGEKLTALLASLETVWDSEIDNERVKQRKSKLLEPDGPVANISSSVLSSFASSYLSQWQRKNSKKGSQLLFSSILRKDFYRLIMSRMSFEPSLIPYMFYTSLELVDWVMYFRVLGRCVLGHIARHFFVYHPQESVVCTSSFPLPLREIMNFRNITSSCVPAIARCRASASFFTRTGIMPSGKLYSLAPGITPERLTAILAQSQIQRTIAVCSLNEGCSEEDTRKRAERILLRIGDTLNDAQSRCLGTAVYHTFSRMYDKVEVNYEAFERLTCWTHLPRVQVVLIPSHRSYVDFMIMSLLTASAQISLPHIASGEDFLQMGPLASFMRGTGAFFIRRSFRTDQLYSALLKEYVRHLVLHRQMMEFFIEGKRSRTGQTLQPKMGLLKFIVDAFLDGQTEVKDVLFVPISVSYDQLLEAPLYAEELLGIPKPKETLSNLLKAFSSLKQDHGSIRIHISDAISLHSALKKCSEMNSLSKKPLYSKQISCARSPFQNKLPFEGTSRIPAGFLETLSSQIIFKIMQNMIITSTSVVAAALESCWGVSRSNHSTFSSLPLDDVRSCAALIVIWIRQRKGKLSDDFFLFSQEEIFNIGLHHLRSAVNVDKASESIVFLSPHDVSHMVVHMSANQLVHLFIPEAVLAVAARRVGALKETPSAKMVRKVKREEIIATSVFIRELFTEFSPSMSYGAVLHSLNSGGFVPSELVPSVCKRKLDPHEKWVQICYSSFLRSQNSPKLDEKHLSPDLLAEEIDSKDIGVDFFAFETGKYFDFISHLLLPHIDAMYVLVEGIMALIQNFSSNSLLSAVQIQKKSLIAAIHRTVIGLCADGYLYSYISSSLDPLSPHVESLLRINVLSLAKSNGIAGPPGVMTVGSASLPSLSTFSSRLHQLRVHPEKDSSEIQLKKLIHEAVVKNYEVENCFSKL